MTDSPKVPPGHDDAPLSPAGHSAAREEAIASLGAEISAATIETLRRMHVSGEPGVQGWIGIAKQVQSIVPHGPRPGLASLRETIREKK